MRFRLSLCLVALLAVCFSGRANAGAGIEDFFGSYNGWGFATDLSGPFMGTKRDFELVIGPLLGGGFEIAWATVKRKGSDPDSLETEVSKHAARFRPSDKAGVFQDVDKGIAFGPGPVTWARLAGDLLVVYRMEIDEDGAAELHVYRRLLTAEGLELYFTATRDNIQVRSVRGSYQRQPEPKKGAVEE